MWKIGDKVHLTHTEGVFIIKTTPGRFDSRYKLEREDSDCLNYFVTEDYLLPLLPTARECKHNYIEVSLFTSVKRNCAFCGKREEECS